METLQIEVVATRMIEVTSELFIKFGLFGFRSQDARPKTPNDPKLSDGGAWRGSCVVERRRDVWTTRKGGSE